MSKTIKYTPKVETVTFEVGRTYTSSDKEFSALLEWFKSRKFIASDSWNDLTSFLSYNQGGDNGTPLHCITILTAGGSANRCAIKVKWVYDESYLIVEDQDA